MNDKRNCFTLKFQNCYYTLGEHWLLRSTGTLDGRSKSNATNIDQAVLKKVSKDSSRVGIRAVLPERYHPGSKQLSRRKLC